MPDGEPQKAYQKGVAGEARAEAFLCQKGMVPLHRRYRSPFGEIDLVMRDGDTLVFVEVKARHTGRAHDGLNAVDVRKMRRIIQTARHYLAWAQPDCPARFDVVELTRDGILHIPDAFEGREW